MRPRRISDSSTFSSRNGPWLILWLSAFDASLLLFLLMKCAPRHFAATEILKRTGVRLRVAADIDLRHTGVAFVLHVKLLVLGLLSNSFNTERLVEVFSKRRRDRSIADHHRGVLKFLGNSRRHIDLAASPRRSQRSVS
jgi:hypothetical protein